MKNLALLLICVTAVSCGPKTEVVGIVNGKPGSDGRDGKNGHSLVSAYADSSELECSNGGTRLDIYLDLNDSYSADEGDLYLNSLVACNGSDGQDGAPGLQGVPGEQGPQGIAGLIGPQGLPGQDGDQGPVGPAGPEGPSGKQGLDGLNGKDGEDGQDGQDGEDGEDGKDGEDGVGSITLITSYTASKCTQIAGSIYYTKPNGKNSGVFTGNTCHNNTKVFELGQGDSMWLSSSMLAVKLIDSDGLRTINFN